MPHKDPEKRRAYHKDYREANHEEVRATNQAYREANREKIRAREKTYYKNNLEEVRATKKAYREANREEVRATKKTYYAANREKVRARLKARYAANREANREKLMLYAAKERARRDNLPFNIDVSDIVIPEFCPVFPAIRLARGEGRFQNSSPSLDKIIPSLGYVKGNVRVISWRANMLLSNMTLEEAELVLKDKRRIYLVPSPRVSLLQKTKLRGVG